MSWWLWIAIAVPFALVIGTVYNAFKEQKKLEQGTLKDILEKRRAENEAYRKEHGTDLPRRPYDDEEDD